MGKYLVAAVAALVAGASPAFAATAIYSLSVADPQAGLGSGPFGTVTVVEDAGTLIFTETVASGFSIHASNSKHPAIAFNLNSASGVTISGFSNDFALVSGGTKASPFGDFSYAIDCTGCAPGTNSTIKTLSFTAKANSGSLTLASLVANTYNQQQIYFASDVVSLLGNSSGNTGNTGGTLSATVVPEPATWAMMVGGFGLVGTALRRRRAVSAIA